MIGGYSLARALPAVALASFVVVSAPLGAQQNDHFTNATVVTGNEWIVMGDSSSATIELGEPNHAGITTFKSIWYQWVAPTNGAYGTRTFGSTFDTVLGVYRGLSLTSLVEAASNDDAELGREDTGKSLKSYAAFEAVAGETLYFAVAGFDDVDSGAVILRTAPRAANDDFTNAAPLFTAVTNVSASTLGASKEPSEPDHYPATRGSASVWWSWSPPTNGTFTIDTIGSSFDTILSVYQGTNLATLTNLASDNLSGGNNTSRVSIQATTNSPYFIAVDGNGVQQIGTAQLNIGPGSVTNPPSLGTIDDIEITIRKPKEGQTIVKRANKGFLLRAKALNLGTNAWDGAQFGFVTGSAATNLNAVPASFTPFSNFSPKTKKSIVILRQPQVGVDLPEGPVRLIIRVSAGTNFAWESRLFEMDRR